MGEEIIDIIIINRFRRFQNLFFSFKKWTNNLLYVIIKAK